MPAPATGELVAAVDGGLFLAFSGWSVAGRQMFTSAGASDFQVGPFQAAP